MRRLRGLPVVLTLVILVTGLCGCPPLDHKFFVRNTTADTARLTLLYRSQFDTVSQKHLSVRAADTIMPVRRRSIPFLNKPLTAVVDREKLTLTLPPKSTVYISDMINSIYKFADKSLVIEHAGKSDTMKAVYPYKGLKGFKRKLDPSYNYFYKTLIYYDIK